MYDDIRNNVFQDKKSAANIRSSRQIYMRSRIKFFMVFGIYEMGILCRYDLQYLSDKLSRI